MAKLITLENLKTFLDRLRKDLNDYAKKSDMPDMTAYAKKSDIPSGTAVDDYCVPDGTEVVTNDMFNTYHLTEKAILLFPPSVKKIDDFNFNTRPYQKDHFFLMMVSLPSCTTIGKYVFAECNSIASITLPNCTTVGENAFYACDNLTSVSLPSCTTIGYNAFAYCQDLNELIININCKNIDNIVDNFNNYDIVCNIYTASKTQKYKDGRWVSI